MITKILITLALILTIGFASASYTGIAAIKDVLADSGIDSVVTELDTGGYNVVAISGNQDAFMVYATALGVTIGATAAEGPLPEITAVAVLDKNNIAHMTLVDKDTMQAILVDYNSGNVLGIGYIAKALYDSSRIQYMGDF